MDGSFTAFMLMRSMTWFRLRDCTSSSESANMPTRTGMKFRPS